MSAIAGIWSFGPGPDPARACQEMLEALAAYGPHGCHSNHIDDLALGYRAWKFTPKGQSDFQPLSDGEGRHWLVADVRIDNRCELLRHLNADRNRPDLATDAGLLLAVLMHWGEAGLVRIIGDFAFAWFDTRERRLVLARDALGQRPLFWHQGAGFVAFSSMPAGLLALDTVSKEVDRESIARHLIQIPPSEGRSYYRAVERVAPAHFLSVSPIRATSTRYWKLEAAFPRLRTFDEYVEAFRSHLDTAVSCRLRGAGDIVATHLSGGWDSSAVTATAARLIGSSGRRILALTSVPARGSAIPAPKGRFSDEGPLAAATASLYPQVEHRIVENDPRSPLSDLDMYFRVYGRPVYNPSNHPWLSDLRQAARDGGAHVLLTGEMGNWTISGGPTTALAEYVSRGDLVRWAQEAWSILRQGRGRVRGVAAASFGPWLPAFLWKQALRLSSAPDGQHRTALKAPHKRRLLKVEEYRNLGPHGRPRSRLARFSALLGDVDFGDYRKGALAGWGVDERDPTADRRLFEFCVSLPLEMLLGGGERRPLARAALADRLPPEVLDEKRKGYQAADWADALGRDIRAAEQLIDLIDTDPLGSEFIDTDFVRELLRDWPPSDLEKLTTIGLVRSGIFDALAAGHFIVSVNAMIHGSNAPRLADI